jgi:hypothetical protein
VVTVPAFSGGRSPLGFLRRSRLRDDHHRPFVEYVDRLDHRRDSLAWVRAEQARGGRDRAKRTADPSVQTLVEGVEEAAECGTVGRD